MKRTPFKTIMEIVERKLSGEINEMDFTDKDDPEGRALADTASVKELKKFHTKNGYHPHDHEHVQRVLAGRFTQHDAHNIMQDLKNHPKLHSYITKHKIPESELQRTSRANRKPLEKVTPGWAFKK